MQRHQIREVALCQEETVQDRRARDQARDKVREDAERTKPARRSIREPAGGRAKARERVPAKVVDREDKAADRIAASNWYTDNRRLRKKYFRTRKEY